MHGGIRKNNEYTAKDGQADAVTPKSHNIETEGAEDGGTRNFDIQAVFVVHETEIFDFIDNETFEGIVEDRELEENFVSECFIVCT